MAAITSLLVVLPILCVISIFQKALQSPLRCVPKVHPTASICRLWIVLQTLLNRRNAVIHEAHQKNGPIVRLGPNEISVNSATSIKRVYAGGFEKDPWYLNFLNYGTPPMFALLSSRMHSSRKKILTHSFSNTAVSSSTLLANVTSKLLPQVLSSFDVENKDIEVHTLFNAMAMDFITSYLFTPEHSSNFLALENKPQRLHFEKLYHSRRKYFPLTTELPNLVQILKSLNIRIIPTWVDDANNSIERWCADMCRDRESSFGNDKRGKPECVYDRLMLADESLSFEERASEMLDQIGAGHETTALGLSFTVQALCARAELQEQLRDEIQPVLSKNGNWNVPNDYKAIERLPLLENIVKESLRLYSPIPGSQPRIVPAEGAELEGFWIPGGTRVSAQPWSLHRSREVWGEDVEEFRPERWQGPDKEEMERWFWAFGSGGRGCIGRWLATYELKMTLAAVYGNYKTRLGQGMKAGEVKMEDRYTTAPGGDKVFIQFMKA